MSFGSLSGFGVSNFVFGAYVDFVRGFIVWLYRSFVLQASIEETGSRVSGLGRILEASTIMQTLITSPWISKGSLLSSQLPTLVRCKSFMLTSSW